MSNERHERVCHDHKVTSDLLSDRQMAMLSSAHARTVHVLAGSCKLCPMRTWTLSGCSHPTAPTSPRMTITWSSVLPYNICSTLPPRHLADTVLCALAACTHPVIMWFLALMLPNRLWHIPYITLQLLLANENRQRHKFVSAGSCSTRIPAQICARCSTTYW